MPRTPDRPPQPGTPFRPSAWRTAAVAVALAGVATSGCSSNGRPVGAAADATTPPPSPIVAIAPSTTEAGPALQKVPCPVIVEWVDCGQVENPNGTASMTFVAVVHAVPSQPARDAAVATIDAAIDGQRAMTASVAPNGADPLAALGPVMRISQLEEERTAILAA